MSLAAPAWTWLLCASVSLPTNPTRRPPIWRYGKPSRGCFQLAVALGTGRQCKTFPTPAHNPGLQGRSAAPVTTWGQPDLSQGLGLQVPGCPLCSGYRAVTQSGSGWGTERSCHFCISDDSPSHAPHATAGIGSAVENYPVLPVE